MCINRNGTRFRFRGGYGQQMAGYLHPQQAQQLAAQGGSPQPGQSGALPQQHVQPPPQAPKQQVQQPQAEPPQLPNGPPPGLGGASAEVVPPGSVSPDELGSSACGDPRGGDGGVESDQGTGGQWGR